MNESLFLWDHQHETPSLSPNRNRARHTSPAGVQRLNIIYRIIFLSPAPETKLEYCILSNYHLLRDRFVSLWSIYLRPDLNVYNKLLRIRSISVPLFENVVECSNIKAVYTKLSSIDHLTTAIDHGKIMLCHRWVAAHLLLFVQGRSWPFELALSWRIWGPDA